MLVPDKYIKISYQEYIVLTILFERVINRPIEGERDFEYYLYQAKIYETQQKWTRYKWKKGHVKKLELTLSEFYALLRMLELENDEDPRVHVIILALYDQLDNQYINQQKANPLTQVLTNGDL